MPFDDEGAQFAAGGDGEAHGAVAGLDFHHQGAQHIDAEAAPALAVFRVLGHGRGDVIVDPVAVALVVVVGATAAKGVGAHLLDGG